MDAMLLPAFRIGGYWWNWRFLIVTMYDDVLFDMRRELWLVAMSPRRRYR